MKKSLFSLPAWYHTIQTCTYWRHKYSTNSMFCGIQHTHNHTHQKYYWLQWLAYKSCNAISCRHSCHMRECNTFTHMMYNEWLCSNTILWLGMRALLQMHVDGARFWFSTWGWSTFHLSDVTWAKCSRTCRRMRSRMEWSTILRLRGRWE